MGVEIELKYRATEAILAAIRQETAGTEQRYQMQTIYYDTPDGSLSARRWTLRRRLENEQSVCTLKTPGDRFHRQEWEVCASSIFDALPLLCQMGAPSELSGLTHSGLIPICGARFTRIAKTFSFSDSVLELALDSGILTGGSRELPLCEVEIELKSGSESDCLAFAEALASRYGLQPEPASKFRRALSLYKGETL